MVPLMVAFTINVDESVIASLFFVKTASPSLVHETMTVAFSHDPLHDTLTEQLKVTVSTQSTVTLNEARFADILTWSIVKFATVEILKTDYYN